ncbi:hypothetical protein [Sorangium atrum]|uniref:Secreted protein n=1 Tax=Sorangium atrum TaxID=2995308 RepID=A0ABT5CFF9_9BACT|nr:hypothetical protein [Sorangium aterium]MDC0685183.1 hypothetical protein [Sorangium aterium]
MRGCWTSWLSGGFAAPLLLAGCAITSAEHEEQSVEAWGDLDPMISEEASGSSDGAEGDVVVPVTDFVTPASLRPRDLAPASSDDGAPTTIEARSQGRCNPDPLPWNPSGADRRDSAPSESDGTR